MSKNHIPLSASNLKALSGIGFACHEVAIIGTCLLFTDDCWCSTVPTSEILTTLGAKERTFYLTLKKLKSLGVTKTNHRYDYSGFIKFLETASLAVDKSLES